MNAHESRMKIPRRRVLTWSRYSKWIGLAVFLFGCGHDVQRTSDFDLLVISDSNGDRPRAWPERLAVELQLSLDTDQKLRLHNESRGGRTLGIDRGGPQTYAAGGIDQWLTETQDAAGKAVDAIIVCLGTNDIQTAFADRSPSIEASVEGIRAVIRTIRARSVETPIWIVSPPPVCDRPDRPIDARWRGAAVRLPSFSKVLHSISMEEGAHFVDLIEGFQVPVCSAVASDGVHLNQYGHAEVARLIAEAMRAVMGDESAGGGPGPG